MVLGCIKFLTPAPQGGRGGIFIKSVGKKYQVVNITYKVEKGKGKQYHLPYDIKAVGKTI